MRIEFRNFSRAVARVLCVVPLVLSAAVHAESAFTDPASSFEGGLPTEVVMSSVAINGQRLTQAQLQLLELQVGSRIAPGVYILNSAGCWWNTTTGASGCLGSYDTHSRYGSGERTGDGSWNHYSNSAGMGVGGSSDGCIYTTTGWSNC